MAQEWTYILIKEASKKYSKTRQTFYNYMRKWLIQTKKVWNKVYMSVADIERIFWNYIASTTIESDSQAKENSIVDATYSHEIRVEALEWQVDWIQQKLYDIHKQFESKEDQNSIATANQTKETIELMTSRLQWQVQNIQEYWQTVMKKLLIQRKKQYFTWAFFFIVVVNWIIITFLA